MHAADLVMAPLFPYPLSARALAVVVEEVSRNG
jgi:hypothetical protein